MNENLAIKSSDIIDCDNHIDNKRLNFSYFSFYFLFWVGGSYVKFFDHTLLS